MTSLAISGIGALARQYSNISPNLRSIGTSIPGTQTQPIFRKRGPFVQSPGASSTPSRRDDPESTQVRFEHSGQLTDVRCVSYDLESAGTQTQPIFRKRGPFVQSPGASSTPSRRDDPESTQVRFEHSGQLTDVRCVSYDLESAGLSLLGYAAWKQGWVGAGPKTGAPTSPGETVAPPKRAKVTLSFLYTTEKERWLKGALEEFAKARPGIYVKARGVGTIESIRLMLRELGYSLPSSHPNSLRCLALGPAHEPSVWCGVNCERLLGELIEQHPAAPRCAPVEPERDLVEVVGEVLAFDGALVGSEEPALQQRDDPVDARQEGIWVLPAAPDDKPSVTVAHLWQSAVGRQSVGDDHGAGTDHQPFQGGKVL